MSVGEFYANCVVFYEKKDDSSGLFHKKLKNFYFFLLKGENLRKLSKPTEIVG